MTYEEVFGQEWYAVVNDLIGGWAVSNVDKPLSQQDHRAGWAAGEICIAEFMDEQTARYVVYLHNDLRQAVQRMVEDGHPCGSPAGDEWFRIMCDHVHRDPSSLDSGDSAT